MVKAVSGSDTAESLLKASAAPVSLRTSPPVRPAIGEGLAVLADVRIDVDQDDAAVEVGLVLCSGAEREQEQIRLEHPPQYAL